MSRVNVICLGEVMVEISLKGAETGAGIGFAGDTFNTAVYLRRAAPSLGVSYATKLGDDILSDRIVDLMAAEQIDTTHVARAPGSLPGLYAIATDEAGERSFLYWRDAAAARRMFAAPGLSFDDLGKADFLYFSGISLGILPEGDRDRFLSWLPAYRAAGGKVGFDSNYRPALWKDRTTAQAVMESAWRQADVGLPSVDDEMALYGDSGSDAVLDRLRGWGVAQGALKRGAEGPVALNGTVGGPFPGPVKVVDSTAAGDSFNAAYLASRLTGGSEADSLAAGHALACKVIGARGAILPREAMPA